MKNRNKIQAVLFSGIALLAVGSVQAEIVVAGWDHATNPYAGSNTRAADKKASGIDALTSFSMITDGTMLGDWTFNAKGSTDETFGLFAGAVTNDPNNINLGANYNKAAGQFVDFIVTNTGTEDYALEAFRFDGYSQYTSASVDISILSGGDITVGSLGTANFANSGALPADGADYEDRDFDLTGLADNTLAAGESVTFHLLMNTKSTFIDNIAVTGSVIPEPATLGLIGMASLSLLLARRLHM